MRRYRYITCTKRQVYRYKTINGGWSNYDKFDREATDEEIQELRQAGYKVVVHRPKKSSSKDTP